MSKSITQQDGSKQRFRVGSTAFFSQYSDFVPGDVDEVEFEDKPKLYRNVIQFRKTDKTRCLFKWRKMSADEFVEYVLHSKLPMEIGKFLVPDVAGYLGFTMDHLRKLKPIMDNLDERHTYEKVIYDSYLLNGGFFLTQEQRNDAYKEYKKTHKR